MERTSTRRDFILQGSLAMAGLALTRTTGAATAKRALQSVDLDFIADEVDLMPRTRWTSVAPRPWRLRAAGAFDRLTVHHEGKSVNRATVVNAVIHDIDNIHAGHRKKNYGDIAYHFIVDYAGRTWEGRSLAYEGAHVADQNQGNIGVMLLGNFEKQEPSAAQLTTVKTLAALLRTRFGIKPHRVYGHLDLGSSACPGKHLYPHVAALRS